MAAILAFRILGARANELLLRRSSCLKAVKAVVLLAWHVQAAAAAVVAHADKQPSAIDVTKVEFFREMLMLPIMR